MLRLNLLLLAFIAISDASSTFVSILSPGFLEGECCPPAIPPVAPRATPPVGCTPTAGGTVCPPVAAQPVAPPAAPPVAPPVAPPPPPVAASMAQPVAGPPIAVTASSDALLLSPFGFGLFGRKFCCPLAASLVGCAPPVGGAVCPVTARPVATPVAPAVAPSVDSPVALPAAPPVAPPIPPPNAALPVGDGGGPVYIIITPALGGSAGGARIGSGGVISG
ncbi:hypothetical protein Aduo_014539 [Ancylostoma duodenale]